MVDTSHIDLLALIGQDIPLKYHSRNDGGQYNGPCPWCGGKDRFAVWPHAEKPHYWCRQCEQWGDAIDYVRAQRNLSFEAACDFLKLPPERTSRRATPPPSIMSRHDWLAVTSAVWQAEAVKFARQAYETLWGRAGKEARDYLLDRGLTEQVLRPARLGFNPKPRKTRWDTAEVFLPRGIVIPWFSRSSRQNGSGNSCAQIHKINIRRLDNSSCKYLVATGSANVLYGIRRFQPGGTAVLVEGEFCALSLQVAVPDLVTGLATGSTTNARTFTSVARLALARKIIVAYDTDDPGIQAAKWWLQAFPDTAVRLKPLEHDINDMLKKGCDIRAWLESAV